mgnify:CR=1 FL=1
MLALLRQKLVTIKNTKLASSRLVESFQPLDLLTGYEEWRVNEIYNS